MKCQFCGRTDRDARIYTACIDYLAERIIDKALPGQKMRTVDWPVHVAIIHVCDVCLAIWSWSEKARDRELGAFCRSFKLEELVGLR